MGGASSAAGALLMRHGVCTIFRLQTLQADIFSLICEAMFLNMN